MPAPQKPNSRKTPPPRSELPPEPAPAAPVSREIGWLPDLVYTGEKFEAELAFFADALGRITRFSREPADLQIARKLPGQAALPGLVNAHSVTWQRLLRGRTEPRSRGGADVLAPWREARDPLAGRLTPEDAFEAARLAFMEMLLAGVTCVGEFHCLHRAAGEAEDPMAAAIMRAAHEVGIRLALFNVADGGTEPDAFVRSTETLRTAVSGRFAADEGWIGVGLDGIVARERLKAIATYAHAQRMRLQARLAERAEDVQRCIAEHGRPPVTVLGEHGMVDKRLTVVHGTHLTEDEIKLLAAARAIVCACPIAEAEWGLGFAPVEKLVAAGAGLALGTASQAQIDPLKDARLLEYALRAAQRQRPALAAEAAKALLHAATVAGARSLGATGGALEVGRPADFFTVNLYDPSIAGADPESLLANVVFASERRAIREVWIGARQRITGGRHPNQGLIVGRYVEHQRNRAG